MSTPARKSRVGVVVPAAGSGSRMGGVKKPFLELAGVPILARSIAPFLAEPRVVRVVVALAPADVADPPAWLVDLDPRIQVVAGGDSRTESVRKAVEALADEVDVIAVHDAARPFVPHAVVRRCLDLAARGTGAVAGVPAVDTIKRVSADGVIVDTPDRSTLWQAQTPQAFPADALRAAYRDPAAGATDDARLLEGTGLRVVMVDAGAVNAKITHPRDLVVAEAILAQRGPSGDEVAG